MLSHDAQIVGDEQHAHAELALQVADEVENLRLDGDVERGRRLVGDQQSRLAGQRHRDHRALPHAAREPVRVFMGALGGIGNADQFERFDDPVPRLAPGHRPMLDDSLANLVPDREHRVERGHGLLEDHGDAIATNSAHLGCGQLHQIAPFEHDLATDDAPRWIRHQAQQRERGDGFAAARFAHQGQRFAGVDAEAHAIDRARDAGPGEEVGSQIANLQQRLAQGADTVSDS